MLLRTKEPKRAMLEVIPLHYHPNRSKKKTISPSLWRFQKSASLWWNSIFKNGGFFLNRWKLAPLKTFFCFVPLFLWFLNSLSWKKCFLALSLPICNLWWKISKNYRQILKKISWRLFSKMKDKIALKNQSKSIQLRNLISRNRKKRRN